MNPAPAIQQSNGTDQQQDEKQDRQDEHDDLRRAVGPAAEDLASAGVDQDPVWRVPVTIGSEPGRQEDVLERHADVLGADAFEALMVAADVLRAPGVGTKPLPAKARALALASLAAWVLLIAAGRYLAYTHRWEMLGVPAVL